MKADRLKERGERTRDHMDRCKETYYLSKRAEDEKVARRTSNFRVQQQRYTGAIRRTEEYSNPILSQSLSFDMSSDMHDPRARVSPRDDMLTQGHKLYQSMMASNGHAPPYEAVSAVR